MPISRQAHWACSFLCVVGLFGCASAGATSKQAPGSPITTADAPAPKGVAGAGYADSVAVSGEGEAQVVRVFYATDREPTGSTDPDEFFGGEYGDLSYGRVEVSILPGHRVGELERPSILRFEFREDPDKHVVLASIEALDEARFYRELADSLTVAEEREALVFIHGYNVSFDRAARRTAQLATPGFPGRARSLQLALGRRAPSIRRR